MDGKLVGEIFICGKETNGTLQVLPQYLGKAITGLGGGCDQLFVIEEDEGFLGGVNAVMPHLGNLNERGFRNNTHDGNRPSGRKNIPVHQPFGMTPFDQQQAPHMHNPLALLDQKIEERESLRHSTHRSQRSERISQQQQQQQAASNSAGAAGATNGGNFATSNGAAQATTGSDNFEQAN